MSGHEPRSALQELVLEAFRTAARRGKPEWYRMAGTVLKNRLLDLTERSFDESDYGAERFGALVELLDDLLIVDHSAKPFLVELREPYRSEIQQSDAASGSSSGRTIRSDLWHAVVDYSHGQRWILDRATGRAIRLREEDDTCGEADLPTLDRATLQTWRADFAEECSATATEPERLQLDTWSTERHRDCGTMPKRIRGAWTSRMRDLVHERLLECFQSQELDPPKDLLVQSRQPRSADAASVLRNAVCLADERTAS